MKLKSPKIPKTAPTHHPLYQLQHKVSTCNFLKSQGQTIAVVVTRQEQMLLL